jgi:hypothetical protein
LAGLEARNQAKMCGLGNNKADAQNNNKAKKSLDCSFYRNRDNFIELV